MKKKGVKKKSVLKYFSILVLAGVILALMLNINFNPTGNIIETASETTKNTSYIYGNGLVASYDSDGNEEFYINDHLGSGSIVLDKNGNKTSEESYYVFGEEKTSGDSRFTYTGKEKDASGLYYYGARYYDADSGRFLQPDPISGSLDNPQSLNKYVYVLNNPNKYVDPSGMEGAVADNTNVRNPIQNDNPTLSNPDGSVNTADNPVVLPGQTVSAAEQEEASRVGMNNFLDNFHAGSAMAIGGALGGVGGGPTSIMASRIYSLGFTLRAFLAGMGAEAAGGTGIAGANIGTLKRVTYRAMGYEEIITKGDVSIWGKAVKVFKPGGYDAEMRFGEEVLNVHFENSGNRMKSNIEDALDTFNQLKEKSIGEHVAVVGDTPTPSLVNMAKKNGAMVRDLPAYPERIAARLARSDTKRFIFRPPQE